MRENQKEDDKHDQRVKAMREFYIGRKVFDDVIILKEFIEDEEYQSRVFYQNVQTKELQKFASLLIIHGFGEHSTRYMEAALQFANANLEVHMFDFRGFGYSSGPRFMTGHEQFYEDILLVLTKIYKNNPLFILCHSMGAGLTLNFMKMNPNLKVSGVICSNPFFGIKHEPLSFFERQIIQRLPRGLDVD